MSYKRSLVVQSPPAPYLGGRRSSIFTEIQRELAAFTDQQRLDRASGTGYRCYSVADGSSTQSMQPSSPLLGYGRRRQLTPFRRRSTVLVYAHWLVNLLYALCVRVVAFVLEPADGGHSGEL